MMPLRTACCVFEREDAFAAVFGNQILMKVTPEWFLKPARIDLSWQRAVLIKPISSVKQ